MTAASKTNDQGSFRADALKALRLLVNCYGSYPSDPPYVGCDSMPPDEGGNRFAEIRWREVLEGLAFEGLKSLEVEDADTGTVLYAARRVRLTPQAADEALAIYNRWNAEAVPTIRQEMSASLAKCSALAFELDPPKDAFASDLMVHAKVMLNDARYVLRVLEIQEKAPEAPGTYLGWVTDDQGRRVHPAEVWKDASSRASQHSSAIMAALEQPEKKLGAKLAEYALECLGVAVALGVDLDETAAP